MDTLPEEPRDYSIIVIPGGAKGAETISQSENVQELLKKFAEQGKFIATICAGSLALKTAELIRGGQITSHPTVANEFQGYQYSSERVVVYSKIISSRGYDLSSR